MFNITIKQPYYFYLENKEIFRNKQIILMP